MRFKWKVKKGLAVGSLLLAFLLLPLTVTASAAERGDHDRDNNATVYSRSYADWDDWGWGWGWGWPHYYSPYWSQYYHTGTVKLEHVDKQDRVYINGAFAGKAGDLKTMRLKPGTYEVEIKHNGEEVLKDHVYVAIGKTVKLDVGDQG